jgi:hypothetical protein
VVEERGILCQRGKYKQDAGQHPRLDGGKTFSLKQQAQQTFFNCLKAFA